MAKKAIVLAAGFGTRLRPFTCSVPKPMLPVWGESMISRVVSALRRMGVEEIAVNCHYHHEQVEKWCQLNGCRSFYEPEILGTGGVLNPLRQWLGDDDFYLVNGDIVMENMPLLELPASDDVIAVAAVVAEGPRTVEVEPISGYVTCWRSPDAGWEGTFTYAGFSLLRSSILDYVKPEGFSSIVEAYEKAMYDGRFVKAVTSEDFLWTDAGTIDSYIEINQDGEDNAFSEIPQIKEALGDRSEKVDFIGARGSDRVFFKTADKVIVIYDDEKRKENAKYASHAKWLKKMGAAAVDVIAEFPKSKTLVLENAGKEDKSFEKCVEAVKELSKFNGLDFSEIENDLEKPMDGDLWKWERDLFSQYCLKGRYDIEMSPEVLRELERVAEILDKEPPALVHRDFQVTNILWKNGVLKFIDFQGMRKGPAIYDLASMVYDPYVERSERHRKALVEVYAKASGRDDLCEKLPFAAVERLIQCLGAYGRLGSVGQKGFEKFVLPALENLLSAADEAGLDAIGAMAEELIHIETKNGDKHHGENCSCCHSK